MKSLFPLAAFVSLCYYSKDKSRSSISVMAVLLTLVSLTAQGLAAYVPGQSYYGRNNYIEYIAGNAPLILTAPHGGRLTPPEIPDRTWGGATTDTNIDLLARAFSDEFYRMTGRYALTSDEIMTIYSEGGRAIHADSEKMTLDPRQTHEVSFLWPGVDVGYEEFRANLSLSDSGDILDEQQTDFAVRTELILDDGGSDFRADGKWTTASSAAAYGGA